MATSTRRLCPPIVLRLRCQSWCRASTACSCVPATTACENVRIPRRRFASTKTDATGGGTAGNTGFSLSSLGLGVAVLGGAGMIASAYHEGLWVPLLRDAQPARQAAEAVQSELLPSRVAADVVRHLSEGMVVVLDGVLSKEDVLAIRKDIKVVAQTPGAMEPNPQLKAGIADLRTDRLCQIRESASSADKQVPVGAALLGCHRSLRGLTQSLEVAGFRGPGQLLVPQWSQLTVYSPNIEVGSPGFYTWHKDGLEFPSWYWILGPLGVYFYFKWGNVRRRVVTAVLYLNEKTWKEEWGGALHCKAPAVAFDLAAPSSSSKSAGTTKVSKDAVAVEVDNDGICQLWPRGGRLVLFDAQSVEHEVAATHHGRWELKLWISE